MNVVNKIPTTQHVIIRYIDVEGPNPKSFVSAIYDDRYQTLYIPTTSDPHHADVVQYLQTEGYRWEDLMNSYQVVYYPSGTEISIDDPEIRTQIQRANPYTKKTALKKMKIIHLTEEDLKAYDILPPSGGIPDEKYWISAVYLPIDDELYIPPIGYHHQDVYNYLKLNKYVDPMLQAVAIIYTPEDTYSDQDNAYVLPAIEDENPFWKIAARVWRDLV